MLKTRKNYLLKWVQDCYAGRVVNADQSFYRGRETEVTGMWFYRKILSIYIDGESKQRRRLKNWEKMKIFTQS